MLLGLELVPHCIITWLYMYRVNFIVNGFYDRICNDVYLYVIERIDICDTFSGFMVMLL